MCSLCRTTLLIYAYKIFFTHIFIYYTTKVGLLFIYNLRLFFHPGFFLKLLRRDLLIFFALLPPCDAASCSLAVSVLLPLTAPHTAPAITTNPNTTTDTGNAATAAGHAGGTGRAIINK
jgi:hypothetical protein